MKPVKMFGALFATTVVLSSVQVLAAEKYTAGSYAIDPMHTKVGFEVPHLVISSVEGRFDTFQGEFLLAEKLEESKIAVTIETNSVDTGVAKRDAHLRSADFFDVAKFPKMTFTSKRIVGTPESFKAIGDLTIKGITKEVALESKYLGTVKDGYGNLKAAFLATTKISRKAYGLTWNSLIEAGPAVGDEVTISLKVQGARTPEKQASKY